jgi:hypothetical protein
MPIFEQDISILIPTYRYRDKVGRAVESALASGAGEIIVTDDRSRDGTMELLKGYDDSRLKVIENPTNLGLWENHLKALGHATRPWIKFIQADDYLLPGGLATYAAAAEPGVTIVWGCPTFIDDETGETTLRFRVPEPMRLRGSEMLDACLHLGWLLGSPSQVMLRAEAVTRDPGAWRTEISADLVAGSLAAAQGDVLLLPPGAIGQGTHAGQDAKTQGQGRGLQRMVNSIAYLAAQTDPAVARFAALWAAMNRRGALRNAARAVQLRQLSPTEALRLTVHLLRIAQGARRGAATLRSARAFRAATRRPHDIERLVAQVRGAV